MLNMRKTWARLKSKVGVRVAESESEIEIDSGIASSSLDEASRNEHTEAQGEAWEMDGDRCEGDQEEYIKFLEGERDAMLSSRLSHRSSIGNLAHSIRRALSRSSLSLHAHTSNINAQVGCAGPHDIEEESVAFCNDDSLEVLTDDTTMVAPARLSYGRVSGVSTAPTIHSDIPPPRSRTDPSDAPPQLSLDMHHLSLGNEIAQYTSAFQSDDVPSSPPAAGLDGVSQAGEEDRAFGPRPAAPMLVADPVTPRRAVPGPPLPWSDIVTPKRLIFPSPAATLATPSSTDTDLIAIDAGAGDTPDYHTSEPYGEEEAYNPQTTPTPLPRSIHTQAHGTDSRLQWPREEAELPTWRQKNRSVQPTLSPIADRTLEIDDSIIATPLT